MTHKHVEVITEEIIIHPTARKLGNTWEIEFRVMGRIVIDGKHYEFDKVYELPVVETNEDKDDN